MTMIERIVSGGQTGVDRAALDEALAAGIPCGGWCPRGRLAEDGVIPEKYPLMETPSPAYEERTEWNVRDSDATLIITSYPPTGGTAYTLYAVEKFQKPFLVIDIEKIGGSREAQRDEVERVLTWLEEESVRTLNVAGPRESKGLDIGKSAAELLHKILKG